MLATSSRCSIFEKLSGRLGVGTMLLAAVWASCDPAVAQDGDYPPPPIRIPADVTGALQAIEADLTKAGITEVESVTVITKKPLEEMREYVAGEIATVQKEFSVDEDVLLVPKDTGDAQNPDMSKEFGKVTIKYFGSPATTVRCDERLGGRRNCTEN